MTGTLSHSQMFKNTADVPLSTNMEDQSLTWYNLCIMSIFGKGQIFIHFNVVLYCTVNYLFEQISDKEGF
jgi:hypothetical protein